MDASRHKMNKIGRLISTRSFVRDPPEIGKYDLPSPPKSPSLIYPQIAKSNLPPKLAHMIYPSNQSIYIPPTKSLSLIYHSNQ